MDYFDSFYSDILEEHYSIEDVRKDLNRVVDYFRSQDYHEQAMQIALVEDRRLSPEIIEESKAFFIPEDTSISNIPDWMLHDSLGIVRFKKYITYLGRIVYPVFDVNGDVMGFCGWEKFSKELGVPKYLDSNNYGYKAKATTLYGMEKLEEYYDSNKPVFVVEGIICCLYLRSKGYQALALLGSKVTPYVTQILKRFGRRLILIPDNDEAGNSLVNWAKWKLKGSVIIQMDKGKDTDGCRLYEDGILEETLLKELSSLVIPFSKTILCIRR